MRDRVLAQAGSSVIVWRWRHTRIWKSISVSRTFVVLICCLSSFYLQSSLWRYLIRTWLRILFREAMAILFIPFMHKVMVLTGIWRTAMSPLFQKCCKKGVACKFSINKTFNCNCPDHLICIRAHGGALGCADPPLKTQNWALSPPKGSAHPSRVRRGCFDLPLQKSKP